eukprot:Colp12_sorted_trinity150504_noHs@19484
MISLLLRKPASGRQLRAFFVQKTVASPLQQHPASRALGLTIRPLATFGNRPSLAACADEFPEVIRQWHPHKNILEPEDVTPSSKKKFWFLCDEGHEWEAWMYNRTKGQMGCPMCNRKRITSTNTLLAKYPAVAAEWHRTKNGNLTPKDVAYGSNTKVWWQCKEGHELEASVQHRAQGK